MDRTNFKRCIVDTVAIFRTTQSDLINLNECEVKIIRELTEDEADIDEVGYMYVIELQNGDTIQAFSDELFYDFF